MKGNHGLDLEEIIRELEGDEEPAMEEGEEDTVQGGEDEEEIVEDLDLDDDADL